MPSFVEGGAGGGLLELSLIQGKQEHSFSNADNDDNDDNDNNNKNNYEKNVCDRLHDTCDT